jgi:di/tricarboxylate transporter
VLIGWFSEATCFLINAITYIAVLTSFAFIRVKPQPAAASHPHALHGLKEGLAYAWRPTVTLTADARSLVESLRRTNSLARRQTYPVQLLGQSAGVYLIERVK